MVRRPEATSRFAQNSGGCCIYGVLRTLQELGISCVKRDVEEVAAAVRMGQSRDTVKSTVRHLSNSVQTAHFSPVRSSLASYLHPGGADCELGTSG